MCVRKRWGGCVHKCLYLCVEKKIPCPFKKRAPNTYYVQRPLFTVSGEFLSEHVRHLPGLPTVWHRAHAALACHANSRRCYSSRKGEFDTAWWYESANARECTVHEPRCTCRGKARGGGAAHSRLSGYTAVRVTSSRHGRRGARCECTHRPDGRCGDGTQRPPWRGRLARGEGAGGPGELHGAHGGRHGTGSCTARTRGAIWSRRVRARARR